MSFDIHAIPSIDILKNHNLAYWEGLKNNPIEIANSQIVYPNTPFGWLSNIISTDFTNEEDALVVEKVEQIIEYFKYRRNLPFSWWIEADKEPPILFTILKKHKIIFREESRGLTLDLNKLIKIEPPKEFKVVEVSNKEDIKDMVKVLMEAYAKSKKSCEFTENLFWQAIVPTKVLHFIGKEKGKAVTIGSLFIDQKIARIFHVGTIPEARNKKYGTYLMYTMLEKAKSFDCNYSAIMSPLEGLNMCKRLGYTEIGKFHHYMTK
jgi:hypothetical protein